MCYVVCISIYGLKLLSHLSYVLVSKPFCWYKDIVWYLEIPSFVWSCLWQFLSMFFESVIFVGIHFMIIWWEFEKYLKFIYWYSWSSLMQIPLVVFILLFFWTTWFFWKYDDGHVLISSCIVAVWQSKWYSDNYNI